MTALCAECGNPRAHELHERVAGFPAPHAHDFRPPALMAAIEANNRKAASRCDCTFENSPGYGKHRAECPSRFNRSAAAARCDCPTVSEHSATIIHRAGCPSATKRKAAGLPVVASVQDRIAVMASRRSPSSAATLDFFPTPPFATRALIEDILKPLGVWNRDDKVWDPCCGEGHMSEVLKEYYADVYASDVHDYGKGYAVGNFPGASGLMLADRSECPWDRPNFIFANPPFLLAEQFLERALQETKFGVALILRTAWLEGQERYRDIFSRTPPSIVAQFSERVTMVEGVWDPEVSSATAYAWLLWLDGGAAIDTRFKWIRPGAVDRYTKPDDVRRFAGISPRRAELQNRGSV